MADRDELEQQRGVLAAITLTAEAEVIPGKPDEPANAPQEQEDR